MIHSFLESVKYASYMIPVAFVRIYFGYLYFESGLIKIKSEFLVQPKLAAQMSEWLPQSSAPDWYRFWLESVVIPNWKLFAYTLTYCEFLIAISLIFGFLVRPISLLGLLLSIQMMYAIGVPHTEVHQLHILLFLMFIWLGAGRCVGFDYFFYKRQRGLCW